MSLQPRVSRVGYVHLNLVQHAAAAQFGDTAYTDLRNRTIALQRAIPNFEGDETRFAAYSLFFRPELVLLGGPEAVLNTRNPFGEIDVGAIKVNLTATSSLIRVGTSGPLTAHSRVKHIRQFNQVNPYNPPLEPIRPNRDVRRINPPPVEIKRSNSE